MVSGRQIPLVVWCPVEDLDLEPELCRQRLGAGVAGVAAVVELDFLGGRAKLPQGIDLLTLVHY